MDVKTLSAMLGHVSAATTLDIYTHITEDMQAEAAAKIDRGLGYEVQEKVSQPEPPQMTDFQPVGGQIRRSGTGCITEINDHLFEGRYSPVWPDGKKHSRNVYGHTEAECEEKLAELILQMKEEIAALRSGASTEYPDGVSPKKKAIAACLRENPGVNNKSYLARQLGMAITTVQKYYDEVRAELRGEESPVPQT